MLAITGAFLKKWNPVFFSISDTLVWYSCHLSLRSSLFGIITAKTCAFSWPSGKLLPRSSATMTFHVDSGISIPRGRSVDLSVGVELTAFCVAYVTGHEPPRHPVRDAFRCVPTGGELWSQHETIVRGTPGVARIAERQVGRNHIRGDARL